jgi:ribosomal protein S18 acetylase RimI-like enzyme
MNLFPSDGFSYAALADLFTRGYEGYFVPVHVDEPTLRYMVETWDIDLSRSRVAPDVGLCNLAIRGDRGWIGGLAVVPEERRNGIGRALMEAVLELAPPTVSLEVIEANEPAIRLYESLGFEKTRVLEVWHVDAPLVEAESVAQAVLGQTGLPWQREDASLPPDYERVEVDGGAMLHRGATVFQLEARDEHAAAALLSRGTTLNYVNVPEDDQVAIGALRRLGGELRLKQYEMVLRR